MATNARSLVVGVFTDHYEAQRAIDVLQRAGFSGDQISFVERTAGGRTEGDIPADQPGAGLPTASGTATPATVSGQSAGSVVNILGDAWAALTGSVKRGEHKLKDALVKMGVPEGDADYYQDEFEAGRTIVTVRTTDRYEDAVGILRENGAYDVETPRGA